MLSYVSYISPIPLNYSNANNDDNHDHDEDAVALNNALPLSSSPPLPSASGNDGDMNEMQHYADIECKGNGKKKSAPPDPGSFGYIAEVKRSATGNYRLPYQVTSELTDWIYDRQDDLFENFIKDLKN
ncbi:hypothetical protein FHL15_010970 [Xylaria flabelliformis]|uniref:Uncharacterized protein n=1 Tax=Xylaria flabelliformis TaxID=2512241 RepID=A0A553HJK3_9PEZI|nr:hypothetical protein FHL15_010970 [Xylaria flabelliformis]